MTVPIFSATRPATKSSLGFALSTIAAAPDATSEPLKLAAKSEAEVSQGAGLGEPLSTTEGKALLAAYATPARVDDWRAPWRGRPNWNGTSASPARRCTPGRTRVRSLGCSSAYASTLSRRSSSSMGALSPALARLGVSTEAARRLGFLGHGESGGKLRAAVGGRSLRGLAIGPESQGQLPTRTARSCARLLRAPERK